MIRFDPPEERKIKHSWTGLKGKTLWDWIKLLIIPIALSILTFAFNYYQSTDEDDRKMHDLMNNYFDDMSSLILENELLESEPNDAVRNIARARTITTLGLLDKRRKFSILQFLYEARLIDSEDGQVPSYRIVDISYANFSDITCLLENIQNADLSYVFFWDADFSGVNLSGSNLSFAQFHRSNLSSATLEGVALSGADLTKSDLTNAKLTGSTLINAKLSNATLVGADLTGTDLDGADLDHANLSNAILIDTNVTKGQLAKVKSVKGATMPDGTKHE